MAHKSENNKTCLICGKNFHVKPYAIKRGRGKYCCKKCYNEGRRLFMMGKGNPQYGQHWGSGDGNPNWKGGVSKYKYSVYRRNSLKRGLVFDLTLEDFLSLWQKSCSYCGSSIDTIGIDRIDSGIGYVVGNITPCCELCNWMKRELPLSVFKEHISKIYFYGGGDVQ